MITYLLTAHHACVAHRAANVITWTKSFWHQGGDELNLSLSIFICIYMCLYITPLCVLKLIATKSVSTTV